MLQLLTNHPIQANQFVTVREPQSLVYYRLTPPALDELSVMLGLGAVYPFQL